MVSGFGEFNEVSSLGRRYRSVLNTKNFFNVVTKFGPIILRFVDSFLYEEGPKTSANLAGTCFCD